MLKNKMNEKTINMINDGELDYLVGSFLDIDDINDALKESNRYDKGSRGDELNNGDGYWYDNVVSTKTSTTSILETYDNVKEKNIEIVVRNEEFSGSMVEDVRIKGGK